MTFAGRRVLVVEDEFLAALATADFLKSVGCDVVGPAARLGAALHLARSEPLDLAVLDMNLAGEMVWPVAEALRSRNVPFLFLTACSAWNVVPPAFADSLCLAKPLEEHRLRGHLDSIWAGKP
jgi:DNA-binding response OmpR family regulator